MKVKTKTKTNTMTNMKMKMKMQVKVKVEMKMKMKIRKYLQDTTKILLRYLQRHSYRRPRHQEYHLPNLSRCVCFLLLS